MLTYRPDIDGLRAVAVLAVVVFHAVPAGLPGGFLGVDIFFVISGFLITSILMSEMERAQFGLWDFYGRRARRLLPALLPMILFAIVASALLFPPRLFDAAVESGFWSLGFLANWHFHDALDYFGPLAIEKPLLHLWSLGVEEQFYIVFPVLLWSLFKLGGRRAVLIALSVLTFASFALWLYWLAEDPRGAFYNTLARVWQLGAGALLAVGGSRTSASRSGMLTLVGLLLIGFSFILSAFRADLSPEMALAVPAVLGAVLLIHAGRAGAGERQKILSNRVMIWIGKRSYGLYLWHWPLLIFGNLLFPQFGMLTVVGIILLSVLLADLSYRWLEQPIRTRRRFRTAWRGVAAALIGLAGSAGLIAAVQASPQSLPQISDRDLRDYDAARVRTVAAAFRAARIRECWVSNMEAARAALDTCVAIDPEKRNVLLVGDSHSAQLYPALTERDASLSVSLIAANSCNLAYVENPVSREICDLYADFLMADPRVEAFDAIILAPRLIASSVGEYMKFVEALDERRDTPIVLIGPVQYYNPSLQLLYPIHANDDPETLGRKFGSAIDESFFQTDARLADFADRHVGIHYASSLSVTCPDGPQSCTHLGSDGLPITMDASHFSPTGVRDLLAGLEARGVMTLVSSGG